MYYKHRWWDQLFKHLIDNRIQTRRSMNPIRENNSLLANVQTGTDASFKVVALDEDNVKYVFSSYEGTVEYFVKDHSQYRYRMILHEVRNTMGKVYDIREPSEIVERIMQECYKTGLHIITSIRYD